MAKPISEQSLNDILSIVNRLSGKIRSEQIMALLKEPLSLKSLRKRLHILENKRKIVIEGTGRGTLYSSLQAGASPLVRDVSLSSTAEEMRAYVNQPENARKPVGYNQDFLEQYEPNRTAYLSVDEKKLLHRIGRTPQSTQPAGTYGREILGRLLIDLSWNSSRLEGNTYSLLDTQRLIDLGQAAENKSPLDAQMILNHKDAIEFLVESAGEVGFNRYTILNLHALLANNLLPDPRAVGRVRSGGVGIAKSVFHPLENPQRLEANFDILLAKAAAIQDPFEQAFFIMVQLPYLQPFEDVNKRVSRLAANIPLFKNNLAPLSFVDMPDGAYIQGVLAVYELNRVELLKEVFIWAYQRSAGRYSALQQSLGEPDPFKLRYRLQLQNAVRQVVEGRMNQAQASGAVARVAQELPVADQSRFKEMVEDELLALHEGSFARYRIRPSDFDAWRVVWKG